MSDRPKWMPSRESLLSLAHNETLYTDCGHDFAGEELEEMVKEVGLRAQIEVLEWAQAQTYMHVGLAINVKIVSLRKELENG